MPDFWSEARAALMPVLLKHAPTLIYEERVMIAEDAAREIKDPVEHFESRAADVEVGSHDAPTIMGETGIIYVCSKCGVPVESEPCQEHQPHAYARCIGADVEVGGEP